MRRKYNTTNGGLVELLCSIALGAVVMLLMCKICITTIKPLTAELEKVQTQQQMEVDELEKLVEELDDIK